MNIVIQLIKTLNSLNWFKDELISAYSIAFDSYASKLYCGFNKAIKVFDISRPGRDCKDIHLKGTCSFWKIIFFIFY